MTIGIYTKAVNHFIETLAYFISLGGRFKVVLITDDTGGVPSSEHPWCLKRLKNLKTIEIVLPAGPVHKLDWLYIHISGNYPLWNKNLNNWLRPAKKVGCLRESHYRGGWKAAARELIYTFPYYLFAQSIVLQDSKGTWHPYFSIRNKYFYPPSPHPQFFVNKNYGKSLLNPPVEEAERRAFRFVFIGSKNPAERGKLLQRLRNKLSGMKNIILTDVFPPVNMPVNKINVLWIEYDNQSQKRGLNPAIYAQALGKSDFCICPLGWGGNWTHRVPESLLRGTIPILEDEKRYNIGLKDMETCVVVKGGNWAEAIEKAYYIDYPRVKEMRLNVMKLRKRCLLPHAAALQLRKALRLE
ncbi:MAG: hypothetical protein WBC74_03845 [Candidatus Omnitrophota bacterium]